MSTAPVTSTCEPLARKSMPHECYQQAMGVELCSAATSRRLSDDLWVPTTAAAVACGLLTLTIASPLDDLSTLGVGLVQHAATRCVAARRAKTLWQLLRAAPKCHSMLCVNLVQSCVQQLAVSCPGVPTATAAVAYGRLELMSAPHLYASSKLGVELVQRRVQQQAVRGPWGAHHDRRQRRTVHSHAPYAAALAAAGDGWPRWLTLSPPKLRTGRGGLVMPT